MGFLESLSFRVKHKMFDGLTKVGILKKRPLIDKPGRNDYTLWKANYGRTRWK